MALRNPVAVAGALLGGALAAWIVTFVRMRGMDSGPVLPLGDRLPPAVAAALVALAAWVVMSP
ncbi:MAG TPA: hypothetical protein VF063_01080 [Gaiellaceae bacterium]